MPLDSAHFSGSIHIRTSLIRFVFNLRCSAWMALAWLNGARFRVTHFLSAILMILIDGPQKVSSTHTGRPVCVIALNDFCTSLGRYGVARQAVGDPNCK